MQQLEVLAGQLPVSSPAPHPHPLGSPSSTFLQPTALGSAIHSSASTRGLVPGLRCGGRLMVAARAASLGLRCGGVMLAARLPAPRITSADFSSQPSSVPKPGFAPGAPGATPPPPGNAPKGAPPTPPPPGAQGAAGGAAQPKAAGTLPGAPAPGMPPASGGGGAGGAGGVFPAPTVKSRKSRLGWAVPIIGLPLLAAFYNYQKEYDKAWDEKVERWLQEMKMSQRAPPGTNARPAPPPLTPPPVKPASATQPAAPPPPPETSAASGSRGSAALPPPPAPPPALLETPAKPAAPPPPPAPVPPPAEPAAAAATATPAPAAPSDSAAVAGAILDATAAAAQAAAPNPVTEGAPAPAAAAAPPVAPSPVADASAGKDAAPAAATTAPPSEPALAPALPSPAAPSAAVASATAAALALLQTDAAPSAPLPPDLPPGKLGLEGRMDLSPLGLIQHAVSEAGAQVTDWSQWPERHAQAVADSKRVHEALRAVATWHEEQMNAVRGELAAAVARSAQLQSAGEAAVARFKALLAQMVESSREVLELEVRQAEKRTRLECERARLGEAAKRGEALERLRLAVGALGLAHEARVRLATAAQAGQAVAAGAAAVAAAAESGAPLGPAAAALTGVAAHDPLVGSVVAALPEGPVATRSELLQRFRRLRGDLVALSCLPGKRAGIWAVAVARMGARLKLDESNAVKVLDVKEYGSGGVDAALARTEALLAAGQLPAAAELATAALAGTAAAALAADWLESVRRRAAAEAAVAALNAHAAATWASIA